MSEFIQDWLNWLMMAGLLLGLGLVTAVALGVPFYLDRWGWPPLLAYAIYVIYALLISSALLTIVIGH